MARKYETVELDTITYEKHGAKANIAGVAMKIGFAPVRQFVANKDPFKAFVESASPGELELIVADWKYGCAVRIQGMMRKAVSGDGYTDADHNRIFNELSLSDPDWLAGFVGKGDALDEACRAEFDRQKAENPTDVDENKIWAEYATTNAAEIEIS